MIRFIHTADWQLGKPFGRMPDDVRTALQEARLDAIDAIGKLAADKSADDVLVAGDVFDTFEPGERVVRQALTRMGRAKCRWWLLPGNHDYARAEGLWARLARDAPANVRALVVAEPVAMGEHAVILPAPLLYRRTPDDPTKAFEDMATAPTVHRIGLAHGPVQSFSSAAAMNLIPADSGAFNFQRGDVGGLAHHRHHMRPFSEEATHHSPSDARGRAGHHHAPVLEPVHQKKADRFLVSRMDCGNTIMRRTTSNLSPAIRSRSRRRPHSIA